jgi:NitT/TauT family transport system permease protein
VALVIASLLAQALALGVALSRLAERAVQPLMVALQVTPVIAIAPLVNIWAGVDHPGRAVVALAVVVAFFPIYSGALTGLKAVDPDLSRLFDLYQAGRLQRLFRLQVPSAVPFVLQGHKVAAGLAIVGAVVAEFVAGSGKVQGLAWRIMDASFKLQTAKMFAALVLLGLMGAALYAGLEAAERAGLRRWRGR